MDRGERIPEGVQREVKEETGVSATFQAVIALREQVDYLYGAADFYFVCILKPNDTKILIDDTDEVKKAEWIPISAITGSESASHKLFPNAFQFISLIKRYIENEKSKDEFSLENLINSHCLSHR